MVRRRRRRTTQKRKSGRPRGSSWKYGKKYIAKYRGKKVYRRNIYYGGRRMGYEYLGTVKKKVHGRRK